MAVDWHVEYQTPRTEFSAQGRATDVVDVHFVVDTDPAMGHRDQVTVNADRYSADGVAALIAAKVDTIKQVASL